MLNILSKYLNLRYSLPVISGVLMVFSFPPFNFWYLGFIALVPFYLFLLGKRNMFEVFKGGVLMGLISTYSMYTLVGSFHWASSAAYLFTYFATTLFIIAMALYVILIGLVSIIAVFLLKKTRNPFERTVVVSGIFILSELLVRFVFLGYNYNSFAYIGVHLYAFRVFASIGGVILVSFLIIYINTALGEIVSFSLKKKKDTFYTVVVPLILLTSILIMSLYVFPIKIFDKKNNSLAMQRTLSIATIQDNVPSKYNDITGNTVNGEFHFPLLKQNLSTAQIYNPDIIIYPFTPWSGVIADKVDNSFFNKEIIAVSFSTFGAWLKLHLPPHTIFITWATALRHGLFINEIEYWRNGKIIGTYAKRKPFPFLDYTPEWAQRLGIYSMPLDIAASTSTKPVQIDGVRAGGLICSEITNSTVAMKNAQNAQILFSAGSDELFNSNVVSGEFDVMSAQFRAVETGLPVIRGDRFGPSVFVNKNGYIIKEMSQNKRGILFGRVSVSLNPDRNTYSNDKIRYALLLVFILYMMFLWFRKQKST